MLDVNHSISDGQLLEAVKSVTQPDRLDEAQKIVARIAPQLGQLIEGALSDGDWFSQTHQQSLQAVIGIEDSQGQLQALRSFLADETRISLLIGVTVGIELAKELKLVAETSDKGKR